MVETIPYEVASVVEDLRKELAELTARLARLEHTAPAAPLPPPPPAAAPAPAPRAEAKPGITEEELLAVSAAIAAYLGVRVHIRQIRLISSRAWAQQGRVFIQASHRLHS
jgi:methylmalonyl-CoA carboxyltransferase 12S subunit